MRRNLLCALTLFCLGAAPSPAEPPTLTAAGIVHAASFVPVAGRLPQGGIVSLFGTNLAKSTATAGSVPLPIVLPAAQGQGTRVMIGNIPAPLFYVSPNQINLQVPLELAGGSTVNVQVATPEGTSAPVPVTITTHVPGIFSLKGGYGAAVALLGSNLITAAAPAKAGDTIVIYGTGFGPGQQNPPAGQQGSPASGDAPSAAAPVAIPVQVTIGGKRARVVYSGFTPGSVGLYQLNVVLPEGFLLGDPLVVAQGGVPLGAQPVAGPRPGQPVVQPAAAALVAANDTIIGEIPPGGNVKLLPLPQGVQALGDPQLQTGDLFLAWDASPCATSFYAYQYHDRQTFTRLAAPDGVPCLARRLQPVSITTGTAGARMMAAGLEGQPPSLGASLVLFNLADGTAETRTPPAGLSARRFDANSLAVVGGSQAVAFGRNSDGSGGAGLLLHDLQKNGFTAAPQPDGIPFYGGTVNIQPATAATPYPTIVVGGGASANGPWDKLVAVRLKPEGPEVEVMAQAAGGGGAAAPGGRTVAVPGQPLRLTLSNDGGGYSVRVANTQTGATDVIPMPPAFIPAVSIAGQNQQIPEVILVEQKNLLYALAAKTAGSRVVNSVFLVNYQTRTVTEKALPPNVRDLSQIAELSADYAGTLIGLANSDDKGGAAGLLMWDPGSGSNGTLFALPSGVAAIGGGEAGKAALLGPAGRSYMVLEKRSVAVAPGSLRDPSVADGGMVVFDLKTGAARRLQLPDSTARLSEIGGLIYKPQTNKVFALGESFGQENANQLVWFDPAAGATASSGLIGIGQNPIVRSLIYDPETGMAILAARNGYIAIQLP